MAVRYVTKVFMLSISQFLLQLGYIELDDHLPDTENYEQVKLKQLLTMTAYQLKPSY